MVSSLFYPLEYFVVLPFTTILIDDKRISPIVILYKFAKTFFCFFFINRCTYSFHMHDAQLKQSFPFTQIYCFLIPIECLIIRTHSFIIASVCQIITSGRIALFSRQSEPFECFLGIFSNLLPILQHLSCCILSFCVPLLSCFQQPSESLFIVQMFFCPI